MIGYTTLYGDVAGDVALINKLTKSEVVQIGDELDLPSYLVHKAPGDGMSGKTDEDNIGFTYDELDAYIRNGVKGPKFELIDKKVKSMAFKRKVLNLPSFDQIVEE
jgi:NAD+ synthase